METTECERKVREAAREPAADQVVFGRVRYHSTVSRRPSSNGTIGL